MEKKLNRKGWLFIAPVLVILSAFLLYPIIHSFYLSLTKTRGIVSEFVWFDNYVRIVNDPMFWTALKNTGRILLIQVPIMLIIAIVLATVLNDKNSKGRGFFRTAIFLPAVASLIAYTILFKMLFSYEGMINTVLMNLHIVSEPVPWLTSAAPATFVLIVAMI